MSSQRGVFIIHRIAGRVRLRVEALHEEPPLTERVAAAAARVEGVVDARANPWAGSLAVEYDAAVPLEEVLSRLARIPELAGCGSLRLDAPGCPRPPEPPAPASPERTAGLVCKAAVDLNAASCAVTPRHVDLKILIPGALVGYGLLRVMKQGFSGMPHWITLIKYGFDTFVVLNPGPIQSRLASADAPTGGPIASW